MVGLFPIYFPRFWCGFALLFGFRGWVCDLGLAVGLIGLSFRLWLPFALVFVVGGFVFPGEAVVLSCSVYELGVYGLYLVSCFSV